MTHCEFSPKHREVLLFTGLVVVAGWLCGCATPTDQGPWLVSKPSMQFGEARAFNAPIRIALQLEPGRVVTGGAQASVCANCR